MFFLRNMPYSIYREHGFRASHRLAPTNTNTTVPYSTWRPYAEDKDSGVEWLGEMPEHCELMGLKFFSHLNPPKAEIINLSKELEVYFLPMERIGEDGNVNLEETGAIAAFGEDYTFSAMAMSYWRR